MNPTKTLTIEHRLIVKTLGALERYARQVLAGAAEVRDLGRFVDFFRQFVDACHHGKEEGILFVAMGQHGFPTVGGPIAMMRHDHELGRALVGALGEFAAQPTAWSDADRARIADVAHRYVELLQRHIEKEDNILFPMAEARLAPVVLEEVGERFEKFEAEEMGRGEHERFHALAAELVARYASERAAVPVCEHCG